MLQISHKLVELVMSIPSGAVSTEFSFDDSSWLVTIDRSQEDGEIYVTVHKSESEQALHIAEQRQASDVNDAVCLWHDLLNEYIMPIVHVAVQSRTTEMLVQ